jgi:hypothetical protein
MDIEFKEVDKSEFCEAVTKAVNSIGHSGTVELINKLCDTAITVNRISFKADIGDEIYIIVLTVRLEEGKVLKSEEIEQLYKEGKVKLLKAVIYGAVLSELAECQGKCDEAEYDSLSYKAKTG